MLGISANTFQTARETDSQLATQPDTEKQTDTKMQRDKNAFTDKSRLRLKVIKSPSQLDRQIVIQSPSQKKKKKRSTENAKHEANWQTEKREIAIQKHRMIES